MQTAERLSAAGIHLGNYAEGTHRTTCPQCSPGRKPLHRREPCLSVLIDQDGWTAFCQHCSWKAGFRSGSKPRRTEFKPIERNNLTTIEYHNEPPDESLVEYFKGRGISEQIIAAAQVSLKPVTLPGLGQTKAIAFPFRKSPGGEVVNIKYRTRDKRFTQSKGGEQVFFGLDRLVPGPQVVITEGEIDALSLNEVGVENVLSVPGGAPSKVTSGGVIDPSEDKKFGFVWDARESLAQFQRVVLAVDGDAPGLALQEELSRRFGRERCWRVAWPEGCKDANETLVKIGPDALRAAVEAAEPYPIKSLYSPSSYRAELLSLYRDGRSRGLKIGYPALDELFTVRPGELTVVTGIPNSGKSEWIDQLMVNMAASYDWSWGVCSFENPPAEHISKLIEKHLQMPFWDGPSKRMEEGHIDQALSWVEDRFKFVRADDEAPTIDWILEAARAAVMRYGVRGLVIDPYNELEQHRNGMTETEYVSHMLSKVKRFAQGSGVHVFFVAHPHKLYRDKEGQVPIPTAYDISGGANWANKADNIMVVSRDYETEETDIFLRKVRWKQTGRPGVARLGYDKLTGVYYQSYISEALTTTEVPSVKPELAGVPF